jgi:hypothetical protein
LKFPKQRLRFTKVYDGKAASAGYVVLDLKGIDLEGVTSLAIDVDELQACLTAGDKQELEKQRVRDLLGG